MVVAGDRLLKELPRARRSFAGLPVTHVASTGPEGHPHVVPLWFVWREDAVYISSRKPSRTRFGPGLLRCHALANHDSSGAATFSSRRPHEPWTGRDSAAWR